ncbi:MAG: universal stress protein [Aeromicrobium sp.]|nr:MAG: universal stress protein [Aeromicrobium sp.]
MNKVIIVGVDGSETSRRAAQRAAELAVESDSQLIVMTAFSKTATERIEIGDDAWEVSTKDQAEATADTVARSLAAIGADIEIVAMRGKPANALVAEAKRRKAHLIVVGNRGVQGASRVFGSIARDVLQHAPCDVHVVKTV